jgi:hypothetical protein
MACRCTALAATVPTDYMSLFGCAVETQPADALAVRWSAFEPGFDAT